MQHTGITSNLTAAKNIYSQSQNLIRLVVRCQSAQTGETSEQVHAMQTAKALPQESLPPNTKYIVMIATVYCGGV